MGQRAVPQDRSAARLPGDYDNLFCRVSSPYLRRLSYFNHRTEMFGSRQKPLEGPESFAPKVPVLLDAPKDDPITYEELSKCDGTRREECLSAGVLGRSH